MIASCLHTVAMKLNCCGFVIDRPVSTASQPNYNALPVLERHLEFIPRYAFLSDNTAKVSITFGEL